MLLDTREGLFYLVIGMCTCFIILAVISLMIKLFDRLPDWGREEEPAVHRGAAAHAPAAKQPDPEDGSNEDEDAVVAAIAIALNAYTGSSVSGMVVRPMKRVTETWTVASKMENIR